MPSIARAAGFTDTAPVRVSATSTPSAIAAIAACTRATGSVTAKLYPALSVRGSPMEGVLQGGVDPPGGDQLVVGALLDDLAPVDHDDEVGVADRRQPVGDHQGRPP